MILTTSTVGECRFTQCTQFFNDTEIKDQNTLAIITVSQHLCCYRWIEERPGIFPVVPLVSAGLLACIMVAMLLAARVIPKDSDQLDEEKSSTTQLSHKSSKSSVYSYWAYEWTPIERQKHQTETQTLARLSQSLKIASAPYRQFCPIRAIC